MRRCSNCNRPPLAQLDLHQVERGDADEKCPDSNLPGQSRPWHAGTPLSKRPALPTAAYWPIELPVSSGLNTRADRSPKGAPCAHQPKEKPGKSPPLPRLSTK